MAQMFAPNQANPLLRLMVFSKSALHLPEKVVMVDQAFPLTFGSKHRVQKFMVNEVLDDGEGYPWAVQAGMQFNQVAPSIIAGQGPDRPPLAPINPWNLGGLSPKWQGFNLAKKFSLKLWARGCQLLFRGAMVPEFAEPGDLLQNVWWSHPAVNSIKQ